VAKILTAAAVKKIQPGSRRIEVVDGGCRGVRLVIQPSGSKSWAVRLRRPDGRTSKVTLGAVDLSGGETDAEPTLGGLLTLAGARKLAVEVLRQKALGRDPARDRIAAKRQARAAHAERIANAFAPLAQQFIEQHAMKTRTWRLSARLLGFTPDLEVIPKGLADRWATKPVGEIMTDDIHALISEVRTRGVPGWKRRNGGDSVAWIAHARISKFFSWLQTDRRVISVNPCVAVRRPDASTPRERILTDLEVRWFWKATDDLGEPFAALLKLLLLTGQRRGELAGMRWTELDGDVWTIPANRVKNKKVHVVPLPKAAVDLIASIRPIGATLVFTTTGESPVSGWSRVKARLDVRMAELAKATVPPFTIHDLRRTVATGLQRLGVKLEVTEALLNHISGARAGIVGVYQRHQYAEEKRAALEAWSAHVDRITSSA
jgi:integrase